MAKKVKEKYTGPKVTDTATFIQKARWVHGDKYDYSKVEYVNQKTKVEVVCSEHGSFWQHPTKHTSRGDGCPKCSGHDINTEDVLNRFSEIHGGTYSYKNFVYNGRFIKSVVTCKHHGDFLITPSDHYRGNGCKSCGDKRKGQYHKIDSSTWLSRCITKHGEVYDYTKTEFKTKEEKIVVICPHHGSFEVGLGHHVYRGDGCPKCSNKNLTNEEWIALFSNVHSNKYVYDKTVFVRSNIKITITCPAHGDFKQTPNSHMGGSGCPSCAEDARSERWNPICAFGIIGYYGTENPSNLYVIIVDDSFVKVGLAKNIGERMCRISKESGCSVEKVYTLQGTANYLWGLEQKILRKSNLKRFYPEESFAGSTECLELSELPKVLQIIEDWEEDQKEA